jgi:hypothetical protein
VLEGMAQDWPMLNRLLCDLPQLESLLALRAGEIEHRRTRSRRNLELLVEALDVIAREREAPLSRSYKSCHLRDFIVSVVSIADPDGRGSIDEAMKAVIRKRRQMAT